MTENFDELPVTEGKGNSFKSYKNIFVLINRKSKKSLYLSSFYRKCVLIFSDSTNQTYYSRQE